MARPSTAAVRLLSGDREPVRVATTGPITLSGIQTIDGVAGEAGMRVLNKDDTDATKNGIYEMSAGTWYRAADARSSRAINKGVTVHVQSGTANGGKVYAFQTLDPDIGDDEVEVALYISDDLIADINAAGAAQLSDVNAAGAAQLALAEGIFAEASAIVGSGSYSQGGTGAVTRSVQARLQEEISIKDFGVVGDGVVDDTANVALAEARASALGKGLFWPPGTYMVDQAATTEGRWRGAGPGLTTIKIRSASTTANGVTIGAPTGSSQYNYPSLTDMTIDANSKCSTGAALLIRNVTHGLFSNLTIKNSAGHGLRANSATDAFAGNTYLGYNNYHGIRIESCTLDGFRWTGEHFSDFQSLLARVCRDGFVWENFIPDAPATNAAANEECTGGNLHALLCTRDGFRFDTAEKLILGTLISTGSARYGMSFWYDTNPTGTNGNAVQISKYSSRNDGFGGIYVDPTDGGISEGSIGEANIVGFASTAGSVAVTLAAVQFMKFGSLNVVGWPGIGMSIAQGSPKGGATQQSAAVQIGNLSIASCGAVGEVSHGLMLQDSTTIVQIGNLYLANTYTTGSNYEINCGSVAGLLYVSNAIILPAAVGHEESNAGRVTYGMKNF